VNEYSLFHYLVKKSISLNLSGVILTLILHSESALLTHSKSMLPYIFKTLNSEINAECEAQNENQVKKLEQPNSHEHDKLKVS
jgi:hypothetical protein